MISEIRAIEKKVAILKLLTECRPLITTANLLPSPKKVVK